MGPALLSTPAEASFPFLACRTDWECREVLPMLEGAVAEGKGHCPASFYKVETGTVRRKHTRKEHSERICKTLPKHSTFQESLPLTAI